MRAAFDDVPAFPRIDGGDLGEGVSGFMEAYQAGEHMAVCVSDVRVREPVIQRETFSDADCYQFGCCFEGSMAWRAGEGCEYVIKAGGVCGHRVVSGVYTSTLPSGQRCRTVSVTVEGSWLRSAVDADALSSMSQAPVLVPLSAGVDAAARALLSRERTWQVRLLREAHALELVARVLGELSDTENIVRPVGVSAEDFACLLAARAYIDAHAAEKVTIAELAREVALNEFKLKRGFRQCFDTTVHAYQRSCRMQAAREVIERDGVLVRDAAQQVGYANVSHFIEAYRAEFGVTPGGRMAGRMP